jgi:hypothetical protein
MKLFAGVALGFLFATTLWGLSGLGATDDPTPIGSRWWPSEWGATDQRGAANRLTADRAKAAAALIQTGRIYSLGRVYEYGMPLPGKRHFSLTIPGSPTGGPTGKNQGVYHDDLFSGEIGQIGTQLDGLGHVGVRIDGDDYFYNGFRRSQFGTAYGLEKLGIENVGVFFTRATFSAGEPGIGMEAAHWLSDHKIVMVGSDTWATEVVPPEDPDRPFPVHQWLLVRHGIYNIENLDLEELARDKVYEFAFILAPLKLKGATGSPGNPIAVR